jgi:hypothetical protein
MTSAGSRSCPLLAHSGYCLLEACSRYFLARVQFAPAFTANVQRDEATQGLPRVLA